MHGIGPTHKAYLGLHFLLMGLMFGAGASWALATDEANSQAQEGSKVAAETLQNGIDLAAITTPLKELVLLLVDKTSLQAKLQTWPGDSSLAKPLKTFKIAIGKEEGDKQIEGDNKTPEGIYFTQSHIPGDTLPAKYGPLAIPIDFPNVIDKSAGKTGYGIWLHGVDRAGRIEEAKVTEGCVAFYNEDITRLGSWLQPNQAVVMITSKIETVNRPEDLQAVREMTLSWQRAWAEKDVDSYIDHYSNEFRGGGRGKEAYREYKTRVFQSYRRMAVLFSNLRVFTHDKYAVAMMNQDFNGDDRFRSVGRKVLYLTKDEDSKWRIKREVFDNQELVFPSFTDAEIALLSNSAGGAPRAASSSN